MGEFQTLVQSDAELLGDRVYEFLRKFQLRERRRVPKKDDWQPLGEQ